MDACTIVARRELARARVLADTFRAHHPGSSFLVFVLDGVEGADIVDGASVLAAEELVGAQLGLLAAGNTIDGLTTALVPYALRHALAMPSAALAEPPGGRPVVYLGPGCRVLGPLEELELLAGEHELAVVSRALAWPGQASSGAFQEREGGGAVSHGVLACGPGAAEGLLGAWPRYFAGEEETVYDWFDGIPAAFADVGVLKHPGYGLDDWTLLPERLDEGKELLVDGRPARLVDLGLLDPAAPERPKHVRKRSRPAPALALLRRRHGEELLAAGYESDAKRPYRFAALSDGAPLTQIMRALWVEGVEEGRLTSSPFAQAGKEDFHAYLREPAERGAAAGVSRLHYEVWRLRPDVQAAFPHLDGPDGRLFVGWLAAHAHEDHLVPKELLPPADDLAESPHPADIDVREPLWGVNVAGFFTSELGLGEAARLLIAGLDARGVPALPVQAQLVPPCGQGAEFAYSSPHDAPYPISVVCINGDLIGPFAREVGASFFEGRHTIALWWWEVGQFPPDWEEAFAHLDEVWVGSQHIYEAIAPASPVPVVKMTMPVVPPAPPPRTRAQLGLPDGFLFLYVHDYHSTTARKNPVGVVEAFKRAFPPGSGAKLVVKSINASNVMHEHDRVALAASDHPDITLIDAYVSAADKNAMIAACDCYVSLHRSEGFGLTIAEAMLLGKPAIATRYGGNLEFMTDGNSYLVDWEPMAVGYDAHPYPPDGVWADPDLDRAAELMRAVFDDPSAAVALGERARQDLLERHSPAVAGERMKARLSVIYERMTRQGARSLNVAHRPSPVHPELPDLIARRPVARGSGLRAALRRARQRVTAMLTRRFTMRQRAIDARLHDDLVRLDDRLHRISQELHRRGEARFAETLAMVRRIQADRREGELAVKLGDLDRLEREVSHHLAQHGAAPYVSEDRGFSPFEHPRLGPVVGYRVDGGDGDWPGEAPADAEHRRYRDFEATFRGPEERVAEIQRAYLPLLDGHAPVLDVGCGRGELLDLLADAGIRASGVDQDAGMVERARDKGHEVALNDGVEHLRALTPGSLGAVVAIEVVEHLPYERLMELLTLARSRLRPDGVLLVETVNPHAIDAMKAFWVDPTHQHPVFPEVALELCRLAGFDEAFWFHPIAGDDFDADRETQPIYAVAAYARAQPRHAQERSANAGSIALEGDGQGVARSPAGAQ